MKNRKVETRSQAVKPKGDRLHWVPLSEVRSVTISRATATGKFLDEQDLAKRNNNTHPSNLVP